MELEIIVNQLPPEECSPNYHGHWRKRYQASKIYNAAVFYEAINKRNEELSKSQKALFPFTKARVDVTLVFKDDRVRDEDNHRARFKPGLDALVDAAIILSDSHEYIELSAMQFEVDPGRAPMTIIKVTEL